MSVALPGLYLICSIGIFIVDRITKLIALSYDTILADTVSTGISFQLTINKGIACGMLHSHSETLFIGILISAILMTLYLIKQAYTEFTLNYCNIGYLFIIAGSLSNITDRIIYHGVIDFIAITIKGNPITICNCADIAIVVGAIITIWSYRTKHNKLSLQ